MALRDADHHRVKRGEQSHRGERRAPRRQHRIERQEAAEPDDADLHDRAAQHRRRRHRRRGVRERHPHVQRKEAGLQAEADHQQREDEVALRQRGDERRGIADQQRAGGQRLREDDHRGEHQRLAEQREAEVDRCGALRDRRLVVEDEPACTEREQRKAEVQRHHVGRDERAEAARDAHQPGDGEAVAVRLVAHVGHRVERRDAPQDRGHQQQDLAGTVEREHELHGTRADHERRLIGAEPRAPQARQRRERQQVRHAIAQRPRETRGEQHEGEAERGGERVHRIVTATMVRPVLRTSIGHSAAKPSSAATIASASARGFAMPRNRRAAARAAPRASTAPERSP